MIKWSDQKFFDAALSHIRKQGAPAVDIEGICVNLTEDGRRCAIAGVFTRASAALFSNDALVDTLVKHGIRPMLPNAIRDAHDMSTGAWGWDFLQIFEDNMRKVAVHFNLKYEAPK